MMKLLAKKGASFTNRDRHGKSPIILALDLIQFAPELDKHVLEALVSSSKKAFDGRGPLGQTPLQYVLGSDHRRQILVDLGINVNDRGVGGQTALHQAAAAGYGR